VSVPWPALACGTSDGVACSGCSTAAGWLGYQVAGELSVEGPAPPPAASLVLLAAFGPWRRAAPVAPCGPCMSLHGRNGERVAGLRDAAKRMPTIADGTDGTDGTDAIPRCAPLPWASKRFRAEIHIHETKQARKDRPLLVQMRVWRQEASKRHAACMQGPAGSGWRSAVVTAAQNQAP
jgi:hypothetical protein